MWAASSNVRVRGQSGKHMLALSSSQFDPKRSWSDPSFDHFVFNCEECRWQLEVDRLGGHEIDHQIDFGRPGHGQDRRFGTFENADHGGFLRFRPWRSFSFSPELLIAVVSAGPAGP